VAPPRPGWSRRAQYSLFFSFLALIAGIVIGLLLLALSVAAPDSYRALRGAALDVTAPVSGVLNEVSATAEGLIGGAGNYWDSARQNGKLRRERDALRQQIVQARAIQQENRQLKAMLRLRERAPESVATGRLVGSSFNSLRRFAILSAGSSDGVQVRMPVRAPEGLVGQVTDVGNFASRVMLISDKLSLVPATLLRGQLPIMVEGRGDGTVAVRPLEVGRNPFRPGDIIITSGTGGVYPPLVPVARVARLDEYGAIAIPLADPSKVNFAIVERVYEPEVSLTDARDRSEQR
jgi:rod shape-determining protein MreC